MAASRKFGKDCLRVVILCGPSVQHENTCATLINAGLNVIGICVADQSSVGVPLRYLFRSIRRKGLLPTISRISARLVYLSMNRSKDLAVQARIFNRNAIAETLRGWTGSIYRTKSYSDPDALAWFQKQDADIFVVHTPYWVNKDVRRLPRSGIVLGGHPGITSSYRGSHAAFWAIYAGKEQDVGCTAFLLTDDVDAGDIVAQERIPIEAGDSYITLSWKAMKRTAELQASVLADLDRGTPLPRQPVTTSINTVFDNPTLSEFVRYRWRQRQVR